MARQKILQQGEGAGAVPKGHMLDFGNQRQLAAGDQFRQPPRGADGRAAAAIDGVGGAAENQSRHRDFCGVRQSVPGLPRLVVIAVLLGTRLPLPERV